MQPAPQLIILGGVSSASGGGADPLAPVLTWVSDDTVNPPEFEGIFDDTKVWAAGDITGSNFDRIEQQIDDDIAFGSPATFTHDLDATDLANGTFDFPITSQPTGVALYSRSRHIHYVGGVPHPSAWSNVVAETLIALDDDDYAAWMTAA